MPHGHRAWLDLQSRSLARWAGRGPFDVYGGALVVVPSLTLPIEDLRGVLGVAHYEERMLFTLLLLRDPDLRIVYVTGTPVADEIVEHYLAYLADPAGARARLTLVSPGGPAGRSLAARLRADPAALARVRAALAGASDARLLPFIVTGDEERLAATLGVGILGPAAALVPLGGKSSGRKIAREAGVPVVDGVEDLRDEPSVWAAVDALGPSVLKLDDSFSGMGNAVVGAVAATEVAPGRRVTTPDGVDWPEFRRRLGRRGAALERLLPGPLRSPSVQMLVRPGGRPEVVSTHDQILGGQVYLGCQFPASTTYRSRIERAAHRVAAVLADRGVIGVFGIDFLVSGDDVYFGEINLRFGGTTHPYAICRLLTDATYDPDSGMLASPAGPRCYVASDNIAHPGLVGQTPGVVLKHLAPLRFDPARRVGITVHQLGSVADSGKFGMCAIAGTPAEAERLFEAGVDAVTG